jgi:hypothetical protein
LAEKINNEQLIISTSSINTIKDIKKVRYSPNKRINLQTVDVGVRLTANMIANIDSNP